MFVSCLTIVCFKSVDKLRKLYYLPGYEEGRSINVTLFGLHYAGVTIWLRSPVLCTSRFFSNFLLPAFSMFAHPRLRSAFRFFWFPRTSSCHLYWYLTLRFVRSNVVSLELVINLGICSSFAF